MTKLNGSLPKGDNNGLAALNHALIHNRGDKFLVIAVVDTKRITTDMDTGEAVATARIRQIEPVKGSDAEVVARALMKAHDRRLGVEALPIQMEDEIKEMFDGLNVNFSTGEIVDEQHAGLDDEEDGQ